MPPRSPIRRKGSDASDCTARWQRWPSGHHCSSTRMPSSTYCRAKKTATGITARARHELAISRERHDRPAPRRGDYDVRDGSLPLAGHDCSLKRGASVRAPTQPNPRTRGGYATRTAHASPQPRDRRLYTQRRAPRRGPPEPAESVFDVNPTQDYPSVPTVCLTQE